MKLLKDRGIISIISVSATLSTVPGVHRIFRKCGKNTPEGGLHIFFSVETPNREMNRNRLNWSIVCYFNDKNNHFYFGDNLFLLLKKKT